MRIPKKLKVGGLTYDVQVVKAMEDRVGEIRYQELVIKVAEAHPDYMGVTLLHEIFHAINSELRETDIEFLASAMYQVLKENPDLFKGGGMNGRAK